MSSMLIFNYCQLDCVDRVEDVSLLCSMVRKVWLKNKQGRGLFKMRGGARTARAHLFPVKKKAIVLELGWNWESFMSHLNSQSPAASLTSGDIIIWSQIVVQPLTPVDAGPVLYGNCLFYASTIFSFLLKLDLIIIKSKGGYFTMGAISIFKLYLNLMFSRL